MRILARNIDSGLLGTFTGLGCDVKSGIGELDGCRGVFLNWAAKGSAHHQVMVDIVTKAAKNKQPVIVFDGYNTMSDEEVGFLVSHGVFLWEPAVCGRNFFSFQPHWTRIPSSMDDITLHTDDRRYGLGYHGSLVRKVSSFEKYYKPVNDLGRHRVCFYDCDRNKTVNDEVEKMGIPIKGVNFAEDGFSLYFSKMVVLIDTNENYRTGYMDSRVFQYLHDGIVPLLPEEHRWYHSVFGPLVVRSGGDISYFLETYEKTRFGLISEVYGRLREHLPEADINTTAKRVLAYFK